MNETYHKSTFDKIPGEKQNKILRIAAGELARKGLSNARIKDIAKEAGISYGSMYTYFATKDDLIRTIILEGVEFQTKVFNKAKQANGSILQKIELVFKLALKYSQENPEMVAIWLEISHGYNERFIKDSLPLERDGITFWKELVEQGIEEGVLNQSLDVNSAAFCTNSILAQLMKSYVSDFQKELLSLYLSDCQADSIDDVLSKTLKSVKALLGMSS